MRFGSISRLLVATCLFGCQNGDRNEAPGTATLVCFIAWEGAISTDADVLEVDACWNGRCSGNLTVQVRGSDSDDGGTGVNVRCEPTVSGGLPSRCDGSGAANRNCTEGSIETKFAVRVCSAVVGVGQVGVSAQLSPSNDVLLRDGDHVGLRVTANGPLLDRDATIDHYDVVERNGASCKAAAFSLEGVQVVE